MQGDSAPEVVIFTNAGWGSFRAKNVTGDFEFDLDGVLLLLSMNVFCRELIQVNFVHLYVSPLEELIGFEIRTIVKPFSQLPTL